VRKKLRILFVDDEPQILSGLRRMLHTMRREWEMAFASGGQEALGILAIEPYDVIVSDMRMPGTNGVEVLRQVKARYPQMVRIALSGQASKGTVLKSVGLAHQYHAKPCDAETLRATLTAVSTLNGFLGNERLRGHLSNLAAVPSVPAVRDALTQALQSPDASPTQAAKIISQDPGMGAKIAQFVSSAFFAQPVRTLTPAEGALFLGVEILQSLALSAGAFTEFRPASLAAAPIDSIIQHSLAAADCARAIAVAEAFEKDEVNQAYLGGLFHDIGKLIFAAEFPEEYAAARALAQTGGGAIPEAERQQLGATHAEAGAFLMGLWGLPSGVVGALAFHHEPSKSRIREPSVLTAVHAANVWLHEVGLGDETGPPPEMDISYLADLGLADHIARWKGACHDAMRKEEANV
jgi:HD-like signal output (HDOD) protein/ActR/RegA family two-component response regulator